MVQLKISATLRGALRSLASLRRRLHPTPAEQKASPTV
jgi:hypothetical protein